MRKFACGVLALAVLLTGVGASQAASILVNTDSGNIGQFTFTNLGIVAGTADIRVAVPGVTSQINTVNGVGVPSEPVVVNTPLDFFVTPTGGGFYSLAIIPNNATKTVGGTVGQQAIMPFNLDVGIAPTALPNFFNASGFITSVAANNNPLYNFSNFANGKGTINLTFTATSFTGTTNFAGLFSTVGSTAVGNGSFSQSAVVPEPASVVMMGLGLLGVVTWSWPRGRAVRVV
jgi:hypothetical protein